MIQKEKNRRKFCRHCGGPLRYDPGEVSCLMCSRNADHICDRCLFPEKAAVREKRRKKAA